jgi:hypothetical protein
VLPAATLDFALLQMEEGNLSEAERLARVGVATSNGKDGGEEDQAAALVVLSRVLLARKSKAILAEVNRLIFKASNLGSQDCRVRVSLAATAGIALAQSGQFESAREQLGNALHQAEKYQLMGDKFEVLLAMAEADLLAGETLSAQLRASDLARDSKSQGFLLIERKAQELEHRAQAKLDGSR